MSPYRQAPNEHIPRHLMPYVSRQDPSLYSAIDHASWRFIMKLSHDFFAGHAYKVYLKGLEKTGIETDRIPLIDEMDAKLRQFGWRAVPIVGFIPPATFMEFLSLAILPIACDMRKIENLSYTPAPDIVHEAAGHAPILADPGFAKYLLSYGEIARKVIYTKKDEALYEAIRALSDIKESPRSSEAAIAAAQAKMDEAYAGLDEVSESTALARMGWWTFEYGLIGGMEDPKIYGAGLLSSVGEGYDCLKPEVRKVPFSVDCVNQAYDITKPQPQLFVTPDFATLERELQKLGDTMAFRRGGAESLEKARRAGTVTTAVLESGIQISGVLTETLKDSGGEAAYLKYTGPVQLACRDVELHGHGPKHHSQGFGTPVGRVKALHKSPEALTDSDFEKLGISKDAPGRLEFESGVVVEGVLKEKLRHNGKNLVLTFADCTVRDAKGGLLFHPDWGVYDMACGSHVVSVFGGAADRGRYIENTTGFPRYANSQTSNLTAENEGLAALYARVRRLRDEWKRSGAKTSGLKEFDEIHQALEAGYPRDWLLRYELLELDAKHELGAPWVERTRARLKEIAGSSQDIAALISRGLALLQKVPANF